MTQAICDITTDEVNVDVVVEPQADTMVEIANRAGGMEQVFHDNTLIGNGNSIDLGVNTDLIATKEYVDEKVESIDTYTKDQIDGKLTAVDAQIDANADAIQKTREDLNSHANELTTLRGNQASLGDQVSGIEEKIPGDASATNQLATKADLKDIDLDGYVKKSGDTMTGILTIQDEEDNDLSTPPVGGLSFKSNASPAGFTNRMRQVGNGFIAIEYLLNGKQYSNLVFSDQTIYIANTKNGTGNPVSLGTSGNPWDNVYAKKLNNGADITIPTLGGTLARLEDLIDLRADINEADSELQTQITAQAAEIATKQDQLIAGDNITIIDNVISATGGGGGGGGGIANVIHDATLTGSGTNASPLGLAEAIKDEIADKAPKETVEALTQAINGIIGDYLPLSGGELTGLLTLNGETKPSASYYGTSILRLKAETADGTTKLDHTISVTPAGTLLANGLKINELGDLKPKDEWKNLGDVLTPWGKVYAKQLYNGATLNIPTEGGTLARLEDLANIDTLPDQSGNAGKVLTTDGSTASWQEPQGGGTKIIIKRYN